MKHAPGPSPAESCSDGSEQEKWPVSTSMVVWEELTWLPKGVPREDEPELDRGVI